MVIASSKDFLSRLWDLINTLRSFKFFVRLALEKQLFAYIYVHNLVDIFTYHRVWTPAVVQKGPDHLSYLKKCIIIILISYYNLFHF